MYLRVPNGKGAGDGLIGGPGGDGHHGTAFMHRESERGKSSNDVRKLSRRWHMICSIL